VRSSFTAATAFGDSSGCAHLDQLNCETYSRGGSYDGGHPNLLLDRAGRVVEQKDAGDPGDDFLEKPEALPSMQAG
jgi:hypothetical protein